MSAVSYEAFLPHVLPYVPNCFEDQAVIAIRNSCMDFCRDSHVLQQDLDPISVTAGEATYGIDVPTGYQLAQILGLYYKQRRLERKSQFELAQLYTRDWQQLSGTPQVFTQLDHDNITLVMNPSEDATDALTGRIAYMPKRNSTKVDDVLFNRFLDDIAAGALSRLKQTPDQPYTNYQEAVVLNTRFNSGVSKARSFVNGGMNHAPMRARFQRIW